MSAPEIREISRAAYAEFTASAAHRAFHRLEWLELVERAYPVRLLPLGYFTGGVLQAVVPLLCRSLGPATLYGAPLRKCPVPPATPLCAPPERAREVLEALQGWIRQQRIGYLQATFPLAGEPTAGIGDSLEALDNLELHLPEALEDLWNRLAKKTRYTVRRAVKDGVKLHWASDAHFLESQAHLLQATYSRQAAAPNYPFEFYRLLFASRHDLGLRILYATHGGRIVATAWLLTDAGRCYYWDAATSEEGRDLNANQALVWTLIRWAHRRGFRTVDFVGTARGGRGGSRPGIGHFKRSMGAEPVQYGIVYWYSPLYRLGLGTYRMLARIRRGTASPRSRPDVEDS